MKKRETSPLPVDLNEVGENIKDIFLKLRYNKFHEFRAIGGPSLGLVTSYRDLHNAVARPSLRVPSLLSKQHRRLSHTGDGRTAFSSLRMLRGRKRKLIRSRIIFLHIGPRALKASCFPALLSSPGFAASSLRPSIVRSSSSPCAVAPLFGFLWPDWSWGIPLKNSTTLWPSDLLLLSLGPCLSLVLRCFGVLLITSYMR